LYTVWFERLVPGRCFKAATMKTALDQFAHVPFMYMPAFYYWQALARRGSTAGAWDAMSAKYCQTLGTCWAVWMPAMMGIFAVVPLNLRILATVSIGLVWNSMLSMIANA
jgi:hypothetical protein